MSKALRVPDYLGHILQALERIGRYTDGMTETAFLGDEQTQDAVIRNIEIIGEAANNIIRRYPEFAAAHSVIPWEDIYLMRNRVCHGYFSVDMEVVWKTVLRDLPVLGKQIRDLMD